MSNYDYDDYKFERPARNTTPSRRRKSDDSMPDFLYDARGARVKKSKLSNEFLRTLLFFILPYLVINGIILLLVTATPKITIDIRKTDDYQSTMATFTIKSLLPLDETIVLLNSEPISYSRDGSNYTALIAHNGTFYVEATSANGMRSMAYTDISVLDDAAPTIVDGSCHIEEGLLSFDVTDTQSGVNWSMIYALTPDGEKILPKSIDKTTGTVTIPMDVDKLELHIYDMVGNERTATITATTEQLTKFGPVVE